MRRWYEVRVRERDEKSPCKTCRGKGHLEDGRPCPTCSGFGYHGIKKSKFYKAGSPKEAAQSYKGNGRIMWTSKASKEQLLGVGDYFKLGDTLLLELKKEKRRKEYDNAKQRKEVAY